MDDVVNGGIGFLVSKNVELYTNVGLVDINGGHFEHKMATGYKIECDGYISSF
jgi:hypothetical protein